MVRGVSKVGQSCYVRMTRECEVYEGEEITCKKEMG